MVGVRETTEYHPGRNVHLRILALGLNPHHFVKMILRTVLASEAGKSQHA